MCKHVIGGANWMARRRHGAAHPGLTAHSVELFHCLNASGGAHLVNGGGLVGAENCEEDVGGGGAQLCGVVIRKQLHLPRLRHRRQTEGCVRAALLLHQYHRVHVRLASGNIGERRAWHAATVTWTALVHRYQRHYTMQLVNLASCSHAALKWRAQ